MAFLLGLPIAYDIVAALLIAVLTAIFGSTWLRGYDVDLEDGKLKVIDQGHVGLLEHHPGLREMQGMPALALISGAMTLFGPAALGVGAHYVGDRIRDILWPALAGIVFNNPPAQAIIDAAKRAGTLNPGWTFPSPPEIRFDAWPGNSTAEKIAGAGQVIHATGIAAEPAVQATADAVDAWLRGHGYPATANPEAPSPPGGPEEPEKPDGGRRPQIPGPPFIPNFPFPGLPGAPGTPEQPGTPGQPATPGTPGPSPGYPGAPGLPSPGTPGAPAPVLPPGFPAVPPELYPYVPGQPYPGYPATPGTPPQVGAPGAPSPYPVPYPGQPTFPGQPAPAPGQPPIYPVGPPGQPAAQPGQPSAPQIPLPPIGDPGEWLRQLLAAFLAEQERFFGTITSRLVQQVPDLTPVERAIEQTTSGLISSLNTQLAAIARSIQPTVNVVVNPIEHLTEAVDQATSAALAAATRTLGETASTVERQLAQTVAQVEAQVAQEAGLVANALTAPITHLLTTLDTDLTRTEAQVAQALGAIAVGEQQVTDALTQLIVNPAAVVDSAAEAVAKRGPQLSGALAGIIGGGVSVGLSEWSEDDKPDQDQPGFGGLLQMCADLRGTAGALLAGTALASLGGGLKGALGAVAKQIGHLNIADRVLEIALDASLHASHTLTVQNVLKECRVHLPSIAAIISAQRLKVIDDAAVDDLIGRHGVSPERYKIEQAERTELLPPSEIREFVFRNSVGDRDIYVQSARKDWDWDEARKRLREQGWRDEDIEAWILVQPNLPTPSEFTHFLVRDIYLEDVRAKFGLDEDLTGERLNIALAIARGVGISEQHAKDIWAAHWRLPSNTQGFEMYWRLRRHTDEATRFTEDDLRLLLKHNDLPPYFRPRMEAITFRPMGRIDIRRAHAAGILKTDEQLGLAYEALGYDETTTNLLVEYTKQQTLQAKLQETAEHRRAVISQAARAFQHAVIGEDELRTAYRNLEYAEEVAEIAISHAKMQRDLDHLQHMEAALHKAYVKRIYTREQIVGYLADVKASPEAVERLMSLWDTERRVEDDKDLIVKQKDLSQGALLDAYAEGTLGEAETRLRLKALGYDEGEALILMRHKDLGKAQGLLGKVKTDLAAAYRGGDLTEPQFRGVMGQLGFGADAIDEAVRENNAVRAASQTLAAVQAARDEAARQAALASGPAPGGDGRGAG